MRISASNRRLTLIASGGAAFVQQKLATTIEKEFLPLDRSAQWISETIAQGMQKGEVRLEDLAGDNEHTTKAYETVVAAGVADAFLHCEEGLYPELLRFDEARFLNIRSDLVFISGVATTLEIVKCCLVQKKVAHAAVVLENIGACLLKSTLNISDHTGRVEEVVAHLPSALSQENLENVKNSLASSLTASAVMKLYSKRLKQLVIDALTTTKTQDLFPLMQPHILNTLGPRLHNHVRVLRKVLSVNLAVNVTHYNRIIKEEATKLMLVRGGTAPDAFSS